MEKQIELVRRLRELNAHHSSQIDPDREEQNTDRLLELIGKSGTDLVIYTGSSGVDPRNLTNVLKKSQKYISQMKIVAPTNPHLVPSQVTKNILFSDPPLADYFFIYDVMNTEDVEFTIGRHKEWDKIFYLENTPPPIKYTIEVGYIIISKTGTVRKIVPLKDEYTVLDVVSFASVAARRHPIVYLETTGLNEGFGVTPAEYIQKTRRYLTEIGFDKTFLISGGDARDEEEVKNRLKAGADIVNVGNPLYEDHRIYLSTIRGAKPNITLDQHKELYQRLYSTSLV